MTTPRRIVADVGPDGKSHVAYDEALPEGDPHRAVQLTNLWIAPIARTRHAPAFGGGFVPWTSGQMRADSYAMTLVDYAPGVGSENPGLHTTDTIDHFYVAAGEIVMVLEVGEAVLRSGDTGIILGAVHGWRNDSEATARLIFFGLPIAQAGRL